MNLSWCQAYRWHPGTVLSQGDWSFGEGYAHDIIGDLNRGAIGWLLGVKFAVFLFLSVG